jgi:hypothetical protein
MKCEIRAMEGSCHSFLYLSICVDSVEKIEKLESG